METGKKFDFQFSYTIDILFFIQRMVDHLAGAELGAEVLKDVNRFHPILRDSSDKFLKKLSKDSEIIGELLVPLLLVHEALHTEKASDILTDTRSIVQHFKNSSYYKLAYPDVKRFASGDLRTVCSYLEAIVLDLERLGFKSYWLEKRLLILKMRSNEYADTLGGLDVMTYLHNWLGSNHLMYANDWYVASYCQDMESIVGNANLISSTVGEANLIATTIRHVVYRFSFTKTVKNHLKVIKKRLDIKSEFKDVRKSYLNLAHYVESNLKQALTLHLTKQLKVESSPLTTDHVLAKELLNYMNTIPKTPSVPALAYIDQVFLAIGSER